MPNLGKSNCVSYTKVPNKVGHHTISLGKKGVNRWPVVGNKHSCSQSWAFAVHSESGAWEGLADQGVKLEKQKLSFLWN